MIQTLPASGCAALAAAWLLGMGCGADGSAPRPIGAAGKRELLVLAASSLTDAFTKLEAAHEAKHPEVDVLLSFAGSSAIALQIEQGGAGDVVATASEEDLARLATRGVIEESTPFAYNELVLAVPRAGPARIARFEDLDSAQKIVLGAADVPIGRYADAVIERAGEQLGRSFAERVNSHVVSREANVKLVLAKVELGEADAAFVYRTDIRDPACEHGDERACRHARAIELPSALAQRATYPIAVAARAEQPELARAFVEHVLSAEGQAILAKEGFIPARATAREGEPEP